MNRATTLRYFSSQIKQCVLKKNSANPFEAFEVVRKDITPSSSAAKGMVRTRLISSVVTPGDILHMRNGATGQVAGECGLLEVVEASGSFAKGDRVQAIGQTGLWQTEPVVAESALMKVSNTVTPANFGEYLAHAQALAILKDPSLKLKSYDEVAVSGAQSALGSAMCRVGKKMQLKVLAVVSLSYANGKSLERLKACGAEVSCIAEFEQQVLYVGSHAFRRLLKDWQGLKVVVNSDGGLLTNELVRHMGNGSKMVVTGGAPFTLPASVFVNKGITIAGAPKPTAENYNEAAEMVATLTEEQKVGSATWSFEEVHKAVDAFGLGPVSILKVQ